MCQEKLIIELTQVNNHTIAEIISSCVVIHETQDALDIMADCSYRGSRKIIINQEHIVPDFFDLKTGIAGEILQKFSTYNVQLAIVGDYSKY
jgi:3-deoxy-D-arabino-heptulosonate 7-phosphate (DAHP) synthase